jgi:hypothetical protein
VRGFDAIGDGQNGADCNGHGTPTSAESGPLRPDAEARPVSPLPSPGESLMPSAGIVAVGGGEHSWF